MFDHIDLPKPDWKYIVSRGILLTFGAAVAALSIAVFFLPHDIAPSGVSGVAFILNALIGTSVGAIVFLGNIPILLIGYRMLGGWRTILETVYVIAVYSLLIDVFGAILPLQNGVSDDLILNALFGGALGGVGAGLIYRAGGTMGGTSTLARILQNRWGMPLSSSTLYTDTLILLAAGILIGWEAALYGTVAIFVNRIASDYVLEGASDTCTAVITTSNPDVVCEALITEMQHGIASWTATGTNGDTQRLILMTISRSEVHKLRELIRYIDPSAFVSVLRGHVAYGDGFHSVEPHMPLELDHVSGAGVNRQHLESLRQ